MLSRMLGILVSKVSINHCLEGGLVVYRASLIVVSTDVSANLLTRSSTTITLCTLLIAVLKFCEVKNTSASRYCSGLLLFFPSTIYSISAALLSWMFSDRL